MSDTWERLARQCTGASGARRGKRIQSLWSGHGEIFRVQLQNADFPSLIVKYVAPVTTDNKHPRGWDSKFATERKKRSYQIERYWYKHWSTYCDDNCRVARCYETHSEQEQTWMLLEDLDESGYPHRRSSLDFNTACVCLDWLAYFHGKFLQRKPTGLWPVGTYWHLHTRPHEFDALEDQQLRDNATKIDRILSHCHYQTLVHGDAKVANFCFSTDSKEVAMVDFQYVGGGCGMKDVAYFLGSCLNEDQCERLAPALLDHYFRTLRTAVEKSCNACVDHKKLEHEWRLLYPLAWTDFYRFLAGWMPTHEKIHRYTRSMAQQTYYSLADF